MICTLVLIYFTSPQLGHTIKTNCTKLYTVDPEMQKFDFLENGLGLVSPPHFVFDFSRKMFLLYSIK